jgi:hypothetical protein
LSVRNFTVGRTYTIQNLGTTVQLQWNFLAGTSGITYSIGDTFVCANIITDEDTEGTGTARALNAISGLQRGTTGTSEQTYIPEYATVYGIVSTNRLPNVYENFTWNSYNYNLVKGDPLQISTTDSAKFLNADVP